MEWCDDGMTRARIRGLMRNLFKTLPELGPGGRFALTDLCVVDV